MFETFFVLFERAEAESEKKSIKQKMIGKNVVCIDAKNICKAYIITFSVDNCDN